MISAALSAPASAWGTLLCGLRSGGRTYLIALGATTHRCALPYVSQPGNLHRPGVEGILDDLYASEINVEISWLWDGGIDVKVGRRRGINVKLGDPLNGFDAKGTVKTMAEAVVWLRDQACQHYPDSEFARKYCGFE